MTGKTQFDQMLLKIIDEELRTLFGDAATSVIYSYLENKLTLKREKISQNIKIFDKGLNDFLSSGAFVVENLILKRLYTSFGFEFRQAERNCSFADYIIKLKKQLKAKAEPRNP